MGWISASDIKAKDKYIADILEKNARLVKQLNKEDAATIEREKSRACHVVLDYDNIDIFSIERTNDITIIGYWISTDDGDVPKRSKEWNLHCNTDVHETLVAEYRASLSR